MGRVISVDVGSTWTKGVLLSEEDGRFEVLGRAATPTTVHHVAEGFRDVLAQLEAGEVPVHFSSSAKGGLAIAAVGLVPALTMRAARMTALSAGGRVGSVFSYKLTESDMARMAREAPDILLLAGGTDGGNESYIRHNAGRIAGHPALAARATVVYAGNAAMADEVDEVLGRAGFDVRRAPNVMPELERLEPDGARERIREVFLQRIVKGKGLDEIVALVGREPSPTPAAVLALVEAIARRASDFGDFVLIDMGGATTDVYSHCADRPLAERVVYRGLREPDPRRTVEGDLGMRVSAASAAAQVVVEPQQERDFATFVERVTGAPGALGEPFDRTLAAACVREAVARHAGTWRRVFTPLGETWVQSGKDLRSVRWVIGSGGYLAHDHEFDPDLPSPEEAGDVISLTPRTFEYLRDRDALFPLLGNLVGEHEEAAVATALRSLGATHALR